MRIENISETKVAVAIAPTAISSATTTAQSAGTDTAGFLSVAFHIVASTYSAGTFTPAVTESDDNSTFTAVADADLFSVAGSTTPEDSAAVTAAGVKKIAYLGSKRYVKCNIVSTGGSVSGTVGVQSVLSMPSIAPVA